MRSHYCGQVNEKLLGQDVTVAPLVVLKHLEFGVEPKFWLKQIAFMMPLLFKPGPRIVAAVAAPLTPAAGQPVQVEPSAVLKQRRAAVELEK